MGGLVQGRGWVGWAGTREGWVGAAREEVGGEGWWWLGRGGWVGKVWVVTRYHKVRGGWRG